MDKLYKKWKNFVNSMNRYGIPVPTIRDPKTGVGSVSLTLVFLSSVFVIVGIVGKWSKVVGEIDMNNAMEFFYASSALYFGRQWQNKSEIKADSTQESSAQNHTSPSQ
jgi:hypothetical protein